MLEEVINKLNDQERVAGLYIDLSKAFDSVNIELLLTKLCNYGIRGKALNVIASYLTNRKQCITMKDKSDKCFYSNYHDVIRGVPQGSILGPFLFIMYINNLPNCINNPLFLYADDTSVICSGNNNLKESIETTMATLSNWFDANALKINVSKTEVIEFTITTKDEKLNMTWGEENITSTDYVKFLGLLIDENLNWKQQINNTSTRIARCTYLLREIRRNTSRETTIMAYYGTTYPVLRYGIVFWGDSTEVDRVFKLQKRCIRAMFGLKQQDSCRPYFRAHGILTLTSIYVLECVLFIKTNPTFFSEMKQTHQHHTRNKELLKAPATRYTRVQRNVVNKSIKIYNNMPPRMKSLPAPVLKKELKSILLDQAFYTLEEFFALRIV